MKKKEKIHFIQGKRISKKRHALGEIHQASIKKLSNKEDIRKSSKKSRNKRNNKAKGNQTHDLTVLYTNADQFSNKKDELLLFIDSKQPDIIMITEMLPKNQKFHLQYGISTVTHNI